MKLKYFKIGMTCLVLLAGPAQSQDASMQELEHKLQLRDQAIIELLERVETLEQRVGVPRPTGDTKASPEQGDDAVTEREPAQTRPGAVVVDEGAAERALERSLTQVGALLLPSGVLEIEPGIGYARQENTAPGFITENNDVFASGRELNINVITASLGFRLGLPWDSQLEIGIPYRWIEVEAVTNIDFLPTTSSKRTNAELGDVSIGFAKTLFRQGVSRPDLVGRLTWDTDTGDADVFDELRVSLTAIKRQDPVTFIGGLSYQHTFKRDQVQPGSSISANFGNLIALSPETSMRFFILSTYQNETELSGIKVDGSDRVIATFVVGGSTLIAPGTLLNLSVEIGLTEAADDFMVRLSLPIRLGSRLF